MRRELIGIASQSVNGFLGKTHSIFDGTRIDLACDGGQRPWKMPF